MQSGRSHLLLALRRLPLYAAITVVVCGAAMSMNYAASAVDPEAMRARVMVILRSPVDPSLFLHHQSTFEVCQVTSSVLATAREAGEMTLAERLLLRRVHAHKPGRTIASSSWNYCPELLRAMADERGQLVAHPHWEAMTGGRVVPEAHTAYFKLRYSMQHASAYALLLRAFHHEQVRMLITYSTYAAMLAVLVSVSLLGGRMFVAAAPVCVAMAATSSIHLWSGPGNGVTFLMAATALAATALAIRFRGPSWGMPACFAMGAVLQLFWFMDSHTIWVFPMVALLGYFALDPARPGRRAALWCGAYLAGSGVSFVVMMTLRHVVLKFQTGEPVFAAMYESLASRGEYYQQLTGLRSVWERLLPHDEALAFAASVSGQSDVSIMLAVVFVAVATVAGLLCLNRRAPRFRWEDLALMAGLSLLCAAHFIAPEDVPLRITRYVAVPAGLLVSVLLAGSIWGWQAWLEHRTRGAAASAGRQQTNLGDGR